MRELKDSGVEWIGVIPTHWKISAMKHIGRYINGYAFKPEDWGNSGLPIIRIQDLTGSNDKPNYYNGTIDSRYHIYPGDILISWAATLDAFDWCKGEGWLNQHIFKAIPNNHLITKRFFLQLVKVAMRNMNNDNKHGIVMQHVTTDVFNNFRVPLPSLSEQQRIADFLDRKCADIDNILEKTRASIEEYKKLKQSVITEAVTKGIRGERPMRDSGSTWFGQIPDTWDANKLKYTFTIRKRIVGEDGHTVLAITQKGVKPKDMSNGNGQFAESYANYQIVRPGDFAMNHMDLLTGWVDISKYEGVTSPDYRVFTLDDTTRNCPSYFLYMMQMCYSNRIFYSMGQGVSGMGRWRLPADMFNNFIIACPPLEEQREIATYLDRKCSEIDSLITSKEKFITELESYKKSLIYEYVTGKKEVPSNA